jgi:hypothetical protein
MFGPRIIQSFNPAEDFGLAAGRFVRPPADDGPTVLGVSFIAVMTGLA